MLVLWLPFIGDYHNQGLSNITTTFGSNVTFDASGKIGKCLSASAASNNTVTVTLNELDQFLKNGKKYSISCWVKPTNNVSSGWVIKLGDNSCGLWWAASEARWVWNENDNGKRCANPTISSDFTNWHHLLITVDKTTTTSFIARYYVDGSPAEDYEMRQWDASSQSQPTGNNIVISPWIARLNDIRIYDEILQPKQIKELSKGLVLHYPLTREQNLLFDDMIAITDENGEKLVEELTSEVIIGEYTSEYENDFLKVEYDTSGYNHNGQTTGSLGYSTDTARYCTSSVFNGTQRIVADALSGEVQSVSLWFKTTKNKSTVQCIFGESTSGLCPFIYGGGIVSYFRASTGGTGSRVLFGDEYIENGWNHLVVIKTGDTTRDVYCNGVKLAPTANNYYTHATGFFIGARNSSGTLPFYGYISDVRVYASVLTEQDIKELYHTPVSITNNGTLMTQGELQEV